MEFKTGTLVNFRDRPWVVCQSSDADILQLKPLGGTDAESVGIYLPLYGGKVNLASYDFERPSADDLSLHGSLNDARLLYHACRLSFRDVAGPFQCLGRLSFEPRPYQMVPMILALKQERVRLLISDDVGIGKTLEALLIAKELLDRREISRFAVVAPPHLCEQWQNEIKDKFGLSAEIIRSSTVSRLEKKLRADQNIFRDIPYQVISIDYIKQMPRKNIFIDHCPDFVIVDEVHMCARPVGANTSQQQRYSLLHDLSRKPGQQLVLLTATPHSGRNEEFQSIIGLLDAKFENCQLQTAAEREELSRYFVQRRRADIKNYLSGETVFPERIQLDEGENGKGYKHSERYLKLLNELVDYIREGINRVKNEDSRKRRYIYWDLLALMRGVMSSPQAGIGMLNGKIAKAAAEEEAEMTVEDEETISPFAFNDLLKDLPGNDDILPKAHVESSASDRKKFGCFMDELFAIMRDDEDEKLKRATEIVKFSIDNDKNPIVFCQYINTAEYVAGNLRRLLSANRKYRNVVVEVVTSRLADEERKIKIEALARNEKHVLVCTDCLSEGVNLQDGFQAVIHYDLPWNPNRMEQRNGRIDRFGQHAKQVLISTLYSENNPVDEFVLHVLYKKQDEIRKHLGVYLPIADNDASLMEAIMQRFVNKKGELKQLTLFEDDPDWQRQLEDENERQLKKMEENEKISRTYFAHNNKQTDPTRLTAALDEVRALIGGVDDTRDFVVGTLTHMGVDVTAESEKNSYLITGKQQVPPHLVRHFESHETKHGIAISFASPTPANHLYIGRNHPFVEDLSRTVLNDSVHGGSYAAGRALVCETKSVTTKTTILMMRVRSVIRDTRNQDRELVGEEMIFLGCRGDVEDHDFMPFEEARELFMRAQASGNVDVVSQREIFEESVAWTRDLQTFRQHTDGIALDRARALVDSFSRYRSYVPSGTFCVVEPVLPMDVIAAYVFIPSFG